MKRLLLFLLLLSAGIGVLFWAVGDEVAATGADAAQHATPAPAADASSPTPADPVPTPAASQPQGGPGIEVSHGKMSAEIGNWGALTLPSRRAIKQPDGSIVYEDVFLLKATNSRAIGGGQQQLELPEMTLYDKGQPVGRINAERAFLSLERDASGRPLLDEGKELDVRQTVFVGLPGGQLAGLRLELGDTRIKITEDQVLLTTPPEQRVRMQFDGRESVTLTGKGAQARLPRGRSGPQRAEVELLRDVELLADGIRVRGDGRLRYGEDIGNGIARLSIDDGVQLDLERSELRLPGRRQRPADAAAAAGATIRGDSFRAILVRGADDRNQEPRRPRDRQRGVRWHQIELTGAPVVADLPEGRLETPRLSALPGTFGELFQLTAHGGESRLEQAELGSRGGERLRGSAARRLHLLRPGERNGNAHRCYGFPRWMLGPFMELHAAAGEGATEFGSEARRFAASDGALVWRQNSALIRMQARDDGGLLHGRGRVHYEQAERDRQPALIADGNDGLRLQVGPAIERLRLGPAAPSATHRYQIRYGDAGMQGTGSCHSERRPDGRHILLVSPDASIRAEAKAQGLALSNVDRFQVVVEESGWRELAVHGAPVRIEVRTATETLSAAASQLVGIGRHSLRLLPPAGPDDGAGPAADPLPRIAYEGPLDRGGRQHSVLRGPRIDLHHLGERAFLVDAVAVQGVRPHLDAEIKGAAATAPTRCSADAERLQLRPFVLPRLSRTALVGGNPALAFVVGTAIARPWLRIDRADPIVIEDPEQGRIVGDAFVVLVAASARSALFVGNPDSMAPATVEHHQRERRTKLQGAQVRAQLLGAMTSEHRSSLALQARAAFEGRSTVWWPQLTLHEGNGGGLLSHMQAVCRGAIDVMPEAVVFGGPVAMTGLRDDGSLDVNGIGIDARELRLERHRATGDIVRARARGVTLDWTRVKARAADIEIDLANTLCTARDEDGVQLELANGWTFDSPWVEVNYETLSFRTSNGRGQRLRAGGDGGR